MKIKYTFVCSFLIILYVSAQRPIELKDDKLEHHNTTGKMVKKESIENVNNENNETVPLPASGEDEIVGAVVFILFLLCSMVMLGITTHCLKLFRRADYYCMKHHTQEVPTVRTTSATFGYPLQYIAVTQNETTQQRPPPLFSDKAGETDQLLDRKKKYVNFHRTIDATLSNIAINKLSEMVKSVGLLYWNNSPRGTVIRIGTHFIFTAWHVIKPIVLHPWEIDINGRPKTGMHLQNLKDVHIGFTENAESKDEDLRCRLLRKICFLDMDLDACILELDFDSSLLPAPFNNFVNFQNMWDGHPQSKFVHVIGQHPKRTIVVLDAGCKVISKEDEKVKKIKKWLKKNKSKVVRNGHNKQDVGECYEYYFESEDYLLLDTYLEFGASGGAVVSFTPDGNIALVGVLLQGIPFWYWDKERVEQGYSDEVRIEIACPIFKILQSEKWKDSEKRRIIGQDDISKEIEEEMETDDGDKNAVDKMFASLTLAD